MVQTERGAVRTLDEWVTDDVGTPMDGLTDEEVRVLQ
jgi:hypothetical protein